MKGNLGGFCISAVASGFLGALAYVIGLGSWLVYGALASALFLLAFAISCALFSKALSCGMEGEAQVKDWVVGYEELVDAIILTLSVMTLAFWPLLTVALVSGLLAVERSQVPSWGLPAMLIGGLYGFLALPVVAPMWAYAKTAKVLNPIWIGALAIRAGAGYAECVGMLFAASLPAVGFFAIPHGETPGWLTAGLGWFLFAWTGVAFARGCGLVYHHSRERWGCGSRPPPGGES